MVIKSFQKDCEYEWILLVNEHNQAIAERKNIFHKLEEIGQVMQPLEHVDIIIHAVKIFCKHSKQVL